MEYSEYMSLSYISELNTGEKKLHVSFKDLYLNRYERETIIANRCPVLLNMRYICDGNMTDIFYSTAGLRNFDEYTENIKADTQDILKVSADILSGIKKCGEYLIMPHELSLKKERIFVNPSDGRVNFVYVPGFRRDTETGEDIAALCREICARINVSAMVRNEVEEYAEAAAELGNDTDELLRVTEDMIRKQSIYNIRKNTKTVSDADASDFSVSKAMETAAEYDVKSDLKSRLKNMINDLVS